MYDRTRLPASAASKQSSLPARTNLAQPSSFLKPRYESKPPTEERESPVEAAKLAKLNPPGISYRLNQIAVSTPRPPAPQFKLTVGQPNDQYEQEADRVAEQVMRMPEPRLPSFRFASLQRIDSSGIQRQAMAQEEEKKEEENLQTKPLAEQITPLVQRQTEPMVEEEKKKEEEMLQTKPLAEQITPLVQRQTEPTEEEKKKEEETLQTKTTSGETPTASYSLRVMRNGDGSTSGIALVNQEIEQRIQQERSSGEPLSEAIRAPMEQTFGVDFSSVKIHNNDTADKLNRSLSARAFTTGQDIFFKKGEYDPTSRSGRGLLAHELTHVVQQGGAALQRKPRLGQSESSSVLRHLQAMQQQSGFDTSLYRKEIDEFQQTHSSEQIMAKQEQILRQPEGVNVRERDNSQSLRRCGGGGTTKKVTPPVLSKRTDSGPTPVDCGGFKWVVQWKLDKPSPTGGWIVQKVELDQDVKDCKDKPVNNPPGLNSSWYPLWEAWKVNPGQKVTEYAEKGDLEDDTYGSAPAGADTKGSRTVKGTAEFYEGLTLPSGFKVTNAAPTWILPATKSDPGLTGGSGYIPHNLKATWDCCGSDKSTKLTPT